MWTHRLAVPAGTDLRDAVPGGTPPLIGVPDAAGTLFNVMFVAVANRGTAGEHKVARGFLPVLTRSHHHVADPAFADRFPQDDPQDDPLAAMSL